MYYMISKRASRALFVMDQTLCGRSQPSGCVLKSSQIEGNGDDHLPTDCAGPEERMIKGRASENFGK